MLLLFTKVNLLLLLNSLFGSHSSRHHPDKHLSCECQSRRSQHLLDLLLIQIFALIQTTEVLQHNRHSQIQQEVRTDHNAEHEVKRTYIDVIRVTYEVKHSGPALQSH